jgi:hypothetical protein
VSGLDGLRILRSLHEKREIHGSWAEALWKGKERVSIAGGLRGDEPSKATAISACRSGAIPFPSYARISAIVESSPSPDAVGARHGRWIEPGGTVLVHRATSR